MAVKHWQSINCWRRRNPNHALIDRPESSARSRPPSLRIFHRVWKKPEVFCGNVLISGMFDRRESGCFPLFVCFFCLPSQAERLPTLPRIAMAAPNKKGKCWVSLQLIRPNDNLQQHRCSQPSVAGRCMSRREELHRACNRDPLRSFFLAPLI